MARNGWDPAAAVAEGVVTVRELTHATSAILDAVAARQESVVITRHGKVIALLAPATAREIFEGLVPRDDGLRRRKEEAKQALKDGSYSTAADFLGSRQK